MQVALLLLAAGVLFDVPMVGSLPLLLIVALIFIAATLAMGITFSNANVLFLLSAALRFHVPVSRNAAVGAGGRGSVPLTHFLRIVRGILLKGNGFDEVLLQTWQIALVTAVALTM